MEDTTVLNCYGVGKVEVDGKGRFRADVIAKQTDDDALEFHMFQIENLFDTYSPRWGWKIRRLKDFLAVCTLMASALRWLLSHGLISREQALDVLGKEEL